MKSSLWTFLSVCIRTLCSLLINKLFAIYFGTNGLTLLAHFQNLIGMVTALAGEGLNKGIVKYLSDKDLDHKNSIYFFWVGIVFNLLIFVAACVIGGLYYQNFIFKFIGHFSLATWAWLIISSLLANLLNLFLIAVIQAQQKFQLFSFLNTLNILVSVICVYLSLHYQDLTSSLLAYSIGQGITLLITLPAAWRALHIFSIPIFTFSSFSQALFLSKFRELSNFMAIGLSVVLFSRFGTYLFREYNIATFGMEKTGLWESVMRLSEGYTFAFNATFLVIFYPKISSLVNHAPALRKYLWQTLLFLMPLVALALFVVFLFGKQLIVLLFDDSFVPALVFLGWVIMGDFFKIINYLLSNILIAQGRTLLFVVLQGVFFLQAFGLVYILTPFFGEKALGITWLISYILAVIILSLILRKIVF